MKMIYKDYTPVSRFITENKERYSEEQMAAIVKTVLDAEFASEIIVDHLMWQAKPDTMLGEWLIEEFGNIEMAYKMMPYFAQLVRRRNSETFGD